MCDPDFQFALVLQEQFKHEAEVEEGSNLAYKRNQNGNSSKCLVDPSWELIDPTPDIHTLFVVFNQKYFWDKLATVCVSWSKRMTTCAGICSYQGRAGMCQITLSEPLLKLRPRKDLVETLLHEMIHAFLFVTHNNRDRDGHGPEFHKHMYRINQEAGTSISVYHDFHDEVRLYKQHWWRCNGICQKVKPFFGIVRRATNRAPGPNDFWWARHLEKCGGTFIKIKEPEGFKSKKTQKENVKPVVNPKSDIRNFMNNIPTTSKPKENIVGFKDLSKRPVGTSLKNSSSTIVVTKNDNKNSDDFEDKKEQKKPLPVPFTGIGRSLLDNLSSSTQEHVDYSVVRNHWLEKFQNNTFSNKNDLNVKKRSSSLNVPDEIKRHKPNTPSLSVSEISNNENNNVDCPVCGFFFKKDEINQHLDICLKEKEKSDKEKEDICFLCNAVIPKELLSKHVNICLDKRPKDIKKKCDICLKSFVHSEFFDHYNKCLDEVFSRGFESDGKRSKKCPICNKDVDESLFDKHAEKCLFELYNASVPVNEPAPVKHPEKEEKPENRISCLVCSKEILKDDLANHLDECMGKIFKNKDNKKSEESGRSVENQELLCPYCLKLILESEMENHLNLCFNVEESK